MNKKIIKLATLIMVVVAFVVCMGLTSIAALDYTCGENLTWAVDETGTILTISGTGDMYDYGYDSRPWESYEDKIVEIIIEDEVTSIGEYAFFSFGILETATIGEAVTSLGESAFDYCKSLFEITLPDSVESIGYDAFLDCYNLTSLSLGSSLSFIDEDAFCYCYNLATITLDEQNTNYTLIDGVLYTIDGATLMLYPAGSTTEVYILPSSAKTIAFGAVQRAFNLVEVVLPDGFETIEEYAFYDCYNMTTINIPTSVTSIGGAAFEGCDSLQSIALSESITTIDRAAFVNCESLASIYIPASVTLIDSMAFWNCTSLKTVYYGGDEAAWSEITVGIYNEQLDDVTIYYSHTHVDEDGDSICDECNASLEKVQWSLLDFIKSIFEIISGYISGFISLITSLYS